MKKWICIILACFLLISVPVRGYAVSPVVWGIGEEVILPFLLALLGVQASETIDGYNDLVTYNEKIKGSLLEKTAGLAGMEQVQEWLFKVVNGVIDTDSVVWNKLQEIAIESYVSPTGDISVGSTNVFDVPAFKYYPSESFDSYYSASSGAWSYTQTSNNPSYTDVYRDSGTTAYRIIRASAYSSTVITKVFYNTTFRSYVNLDQTYTYDGKTVYWNGENGASPITITSYCNPYADYPSSPAAAAWLMVYGGYSAVSDSVASYSDAFDSVLTSSEKDDIIDGTSVVQLYNPAALQNGLEVIPGGDPEDDPNLKRIPFAVTAEWWNFIQQFGQGSSSNQYVNAYNALNGLDGASVGRISDAYDSIGIANIVGSAANAAEGIVNLTDNNIYPNSQTVADSVNGTIPQILDPEAPDTGIDNDSPTGLYKLPDLRDYFPFCIPFDLIHLLSILAAEPVTPEFVIKLSDGNHEASTIASLEVLESVSQIVRNFELAGFCLGLILITRGIIRG